MGKTISVADLDRLDACESQVELFLDTFAVTDNGVEVTVENVLVAGAAGLDLHWLAKALFTTPAYVEYRDLVKPAWDKHLLDGREARVRYNYIRNLDRKGGGANIDRAWTEFKAAKTSAWVEYVHIVAPAWVAAFEASVCVTAKGDE